MKKLLSLLLIFSIITVFSSCGGTKNSDAQNTTDATADTTVSDAKETEKNNPDEITLDPPIVLIDNEEITITVTGFYQKEFNWAGKEAAQMEKGIRLNLHNNGTHTITYNIFDCYVGEFAVITISDDGDSFAPAPGKTKTAGFIIQNQDDSALESMEDLYDLEGTLEINLMDGNTYVTGSEIHFNLRDTETAGNAQPDENVTNAPATAAPAPTTTALAVGESVTTDDWEIKLTKAELAKAIYPVSEGSGTYYEANAGSQFLNLEFDVLNRATEVQAFSSAVKDVVVHCGKYNYNGYTMYYDMGGGSLSITLLKGTTHGPEPLDPTHLYVETNIPDAAAEEASITVDLVIAGSPYTITVK